jgi:hypothetical protein
MLKLSILKKRARTLLLSLEVIIKTLFICITRYSLNLKLLKSAKVYKARGCFMQKKYIVRLTEEERCQLREVIKKLKGSSQKVRRAQILLKADIEGSNWTDERIAEAFDCRTKTVENIRRRLVEKGFAETLNGSRRDTPPTEKRLDGEQEAHVIAMRLGPPPKGYNNWSLRLLARKAVELRIVDTVSYETVRRTLKKTA